MDGVIVWWIQQWIGRVIDGWMERWRVTLPDVWNVTHIKSYLFVIFPRMHQLCWVSLQHISLDLNPNEWIRSDRFSISCSVSVELVLQTQRMLFPPSPRADHEPPDCSRETNRIRSETQTYERWIKHNTDKDTSRAADVIYEDELDTLSRHIISSRTWQQIHFMNNSILISTEDALCVFVPLLCPSPASGVILYHSIGAFDDRVDKVWLCLIFLSVFEKSDEL